MKKTKQVFFDKLTKRRNEGLFTTLDFEIIGKELGLDEVTAWLWGREWADRQGIKVNSDFSGFIVE